MSTRLQPYLFQEEEPLYAFRHPVVVVLSRPWETYTDGEDVLLGKILHSVGVSMEAATVVVLPEGELAQLASYAPDKVLLFGCAWAAELPLYEVTRSGSFDVIRSDDLSALDDAKKKMLWTALKQMFPRG